MHCLYCEHQGTPKYGQFPLQAEVSVNVEFEFTKENFDYPLVEITLDVFPKDMAITPFRTRKLGGHVKSTP